MMFLHEPLIQMYVGKTIGNPLGKGDLVKHLWRIHNRQMSYTPGQKRQRASINKDDDIDSALQ